jgi:hypothetical protein
LLVVVAEVIHMAEAEVLEDLGQDQDIQLQLEHHMQ